MLSVLFVNFIALKWMFFLAPDSYPVWRQIDGEFSSKRPLTACGPSVVPRRLAPLGDQIVL